MRLIVVPKIFSICKKDWKAFPLNIAGTYFKGNYQLVTKIIKDVLHPEICIQLDLLSSVSATGHFSSCIQQAEIEWTNQRPGQKQCVFLLVLT